MNYLTITNNSGGNHGHQLKDMFGGLTIAKLFGFTYLHRPSEYLDFFALGNNEKKLTWKNLILKKKISIANTSWDGLDINKAKEIFSKFKNKQNQLIILEKATRIHPCQTINWYNTKLINRNIFDEITKETTEKFILQHNNYKSFFDKKIINVVMHIDRGKNYDKKTFPLHFKNHFAVRYMFPLSYYENIYNQISSILENKHHKIHIYSENANSEPIVEMFASKKNVELHIGRNRNKTNYKFVYDIFYHFVMSDIFIASNSSFSAVVAYFRYRKPMIYHSHQHLYDLPVNNYFTTDENGNFNISKFTDFINS